MTQFTLLGVAWKTISSFIMRSGFMRRSILKHLTRCISINIRCWSVAGWPSTYTLMDKHDFLNIRGKFSHTTPAPDTYKLKNWKKRRLNDENNDGYYCYCPHVFIGILRRFNHKSQRYFTNRRCSLWILWYPIWISRYITVVGQRVTVPAFMVHRGSEGSCFCIIILTTSSTGKRSASNEVTFNQKPR